MFLPNVILLHAAKNSLQFIFGDFFSNKQYNFTMHHKLLLNNLGKRYEL